MKRFLGLCATGVILCTSITACGNKTPDLSLGLGEEVAESNEKAEASGFEDENEETLIEDEAAELFSKAIDGEIMVKATYEDGTDASFRIPDLPNDPDDWQSYEIGDMEDLDNDGVEELIINGPFLSVLNRGRTR